jgi:curved DNA-binding protein CbpA
MRELKQHPDLGGEHWSAAIINEAYDTLSSDKLRREYDRTLFTTYTKYPVTEMGSGRKSVTGIICPVCGKMPVRHTVEEKNCPSCAHDTCPDEKPAHRSMRRKVNRIKKTGRLRYFSSRFHTGSEATMLDLSPEGIRFMCDKELKRTSTVRLRSPLFRAEARIVSSRKGMLNGKPHFYVGAMFTRVTFTHTRGSFYTRNV